jgi:N-acetyl-gamma-glutamyl-phosphate reductase
MLKVAIIGGSGYTGAELLRLLERHPHVKITTVTSERLKGTPVAHLFPNLKKSGLKFSSLKYKNIFSSADLFFLCLPHKTSQAVTARLYKAGKRVIDLSADYRIKNASVYRKWYNTPHRYAALLKKSVYGLPELYRQKIKRAGIVANPGCYPTGALLGLAPLMKYPAVDLDSVIVDSKSGVSGAGRNPVLPLLFSEANESFRAYSVTSHQHTPEIEQELSLLSKKKIKIIFTPHLIPMDRGLFSTMYVRLKRNISLPVMQKLFQDYYRTEPFIRVLKNGIVPNTKAVKGSNFCDISLFLDKRSTAQQTLIIFSAIDNLLKGASGQAVQNMNIMYGFTETTGLTDMPPCP